MNPRTSDTSHLDVGLCAGSVLDIMHCAINMGYPFNVEFDPLHSGGTLLSTRSVTGTWCGTHLCDNVTDDFEICLMHLPPTDPDTSQERMGGFNIDMNSLAQSEVSAWRG